MRKKGVIGNRRSDSDSLFIRRITHDLSQRQQRNNRISIRDYARSLELPVSTLKNLLSGHGEPTSTTILKVAKKLRWKASETETMQREAAENRLRKRIEASYETRSPNEKVLGKLLNLALYHLICVRPQQKDTSWLASQLGVSTVEIQMGLKTLKVAGMIDFDGESWSVPAKPVAFVEDPAGPLMLEYKRLFLELAIQQAESGEALKTNSTLFYFVADPSEIRKFDSKLHGFKASFRKTSLTASSGQELYCGAALIFPYRMGRPTKA